MLVGPIAPVGAAGRGAATCILTLSPPGHHQLALALLAPSHDRIVQVVLPVPELARRITCTSTCRRRGESGDAWLWQVLIRILSLLQQTQMGRRVGFLAGFRLTRLDPLMLGLGDLWLGECFVLKLLPLDTQKLLTLRPHGFVEKCSRIMINLEAENTNDSLNPFCQKANS